MLSLGWRTSLRQYLSHIQFFEEDRYESEGEEMLEIWER